MKVLLFICLSSVAFASGGDLGGGGTLPAAFRLSEQEKARLAIQRDPDAAFMEWKRNLEEQRKQDELMLKVFDNLILPQIQ